MVKQEIEQELLPHFEPAEQSLNDLIAYMQEIQLTFGEQGYHTFWVKCDYYSYDGGKDYSIWGVRKETNEEARTRMTDARVLKEAVAAKKLAHLTFIETEARKLGLLK